MGSCSDATRLSSYLAAASGSELEVALRRDGRLLTLRFAPHEGTGLLGCELFVVERSGEAGAATAGAGGYRFSATGDYGSSPAGAEGELAEQVLPLLQRGFAVVEKVFAASPGAAAGLRPHDEIVKVFPFCHSPPAFTSSSGRSRVADALPCFPLKIIKRRYQLPAFSRSGRPPSCPSWRGC